MPSPKKPTNKPVIPRGHRIKLPVEWGELPLSAPRDVELEWVHANRIFVIGMRDQKVTMRWGRAKTPAPSNGAVAWMLRCASNPDKFDSILVRVKQDNDDGDDKGKRRDERKKIEDIERILQKLMEEV